MSNARTTVPESLLTELAAGQSYFREHLEHATVKIATLEGTNWGHEAQIADLRKQVTSLELRLTQAGLERRKVLHDLAVLLRWNELQAAGIQVMGSDDHSFSDASARLDALAKDGAAQIREAHEWAKIDEAKV